MAVTEREEQGDASRMHVRWHRGHVMEKDGHPLPHCVCKSYTFLPVAVFIIISHKKLD